MNAAREFRNLAEEEEGGAREIRWRGFRWKESFHSLRIKFQPSLPTKVTIKNLASLLERIKVLFLFFFSLLQETRFIDLPFPVDNSYIPTE